MFDIPVREVMRRHKLVIQPRDARVHAVAKLMARRNVGAAVVVEDERVVGIVTERDIVFRVVARGLDPVATRIESVMTTSPRTIDASQPFGEALAIMHEQRFRHLPVVAEGRLVGIVSSRSAMDPDLEEFVAEAARREHFAGRRIGARVRA